METKMKSVITEDGSQIYYELIGDGFPVFMLHGNHGSGRYFSKQITALANYFQLIIVDSRGQGKSTDLSDQLTFQLMATDIKAIIDHEKISQADFIGFSDGANLAMVFATTFPEHVHRLVLNAGNSRFSGLRHFSQLTSLLIVFFSCLLPFVWKRGRKKQQVSRLLLQDTKLSETDFIKISAPTLIIVGEYDVIKRSHSGELARLIPASELVIIPHTGHQLAREAPAIFNKTVLNFLKDRR